MAKTISSALADHIAGEATTLTTIWEITRRDGVKIYLTELDADITVDGQVYESAYGYDRTATGNRVGLEVSDVDVNGLLNSGFIDRDDIRAGLYDNAEVRISIVNYKSPDDGTIALKRGFLGEVITAPSGLFRAQLAGLRSRLQQKIIERTSPTCRAQFGDSRCTVPINPDVIERNTDYSVGDFVRVATDPGSTSEIYGNRIYECTAAGTTAGTEPTYDKTVGNTTTDGTAVFTARQAWTRHGSIASVTDKRVFTVNVTESRAVDDWFNLGVITFESGPNAPQSFEVKDWDQSSNEITLFIPLPETPTVGNAFIIRPGCDKRRTTCREKFALAGTTDYANGNVINFRGEPDLPGQDAALQYPDAQ